MRRHDPSPLSLVYKKAFLSREFCTEEWLQSETIIMIHQYHLSRARNGVGLRQVLHAFLLHFSRP